MTGPEHVRRLGPLTEWASEVYHGVALTSEDRAVVQKLSASADNRLQIEELRQGLRVRTRSWVGVVRLPTVEIRVVPKVTGDLIGLVRLLEYASGLDALTRLRDGATLEASGDSLLELFVLLFVEASRAGAAAGPAVRLCRTRGRSAASARSDSRRPPGARTIRPARPDHLPLRRVGTRRYGEPVVNRGLAAWRLRGSPPSDCSAASRGSGVCSSPYATPLSSTSRARARP